jgi:hypothetical protein
MKLTASARKNSRSSKSSRKSTAIAHRFVICVANESNPASLELRKLYQVVRDPRAAKLGMIRVVDESGEDYLYPSDHFVFVKLPQTVGQAVLRAAL